jgi:hypothetical protein
MADAQDGRYTHARAHTHTHTHTHIIVQVPSEYRLWIISKMNKGEGRPRFTFWLQRKDDHKALQWYKGELRGGAEGEKIKREYLLSLCNPRTRCAGSLSIVVFTLFTRESLAMRVQACVCARNQ